MKGNSKMDSIYNAHRAGQTAVQYMLTSLWLIWSIEHGAWWRPAHRGYTPNRGEAGLYSFAEACKIVESGNIGNHNVPNEAMVEFIHGKK